MGTDSGAMLSKVCRAVDVLIEASDPYDGLFPSILDRKTHTIPPEMPEKIPGQRNEDRSYPGCNLMHDHIMLKMMYTLAEALGRAEYTKAADRYLKRFATHCTDTATGLFPWGEHAFWDVKNDIVGNSFPLAYDWWKEPAIHDHLRSAPFWLLEKLWEYNPKCIETLAEGLDFHWKHGDPPEYTRHANIEIRERIPREERSCDFPRHGGFYIMDWSFAYLMTGRQDFLAQVRKMVDYWWPHRSPTGMLPLETRTPERIDVIHNKTSPGQALSLAMSLFETSDYIREREPELAKTMRERAEVYAASYLHLPHDLDNGIFVTCTQWDTGEIYSTARAWGSSYGCGTSAGLGTSATGFYRITGQEGFRKITEAVAREYLSTPMPEGEVIPAADLGAAVDLMSDMYELTGERSWLDAGLKMAEKLIEVYLDADLPKGAANIDHYEAQMGTAQLLYGLSRIALLAEGESKGKIAPDYSDR